MEPKVIASYGGLYTDAATVENPETDMEAAYGNRALEDLAQLTQTGARAMVKFRTDTGAGVPISIIPSSYWSMWGSGVGQRPTVSKTADPGRYTITYAASFTDSLSVVENVAFTQHQISVMSSTGDVTDDLGATVLTIASNIITLKTESPIATLADDGNGSAAVFDVTLWLR